MIHLRYDESKRAICKREADHADDHHERAKPSLARASRSDVAIADRRNRRDGPVKTQRVEI